MEQQEVEKLFILCSFHECTISASVELLNLLPCFVGFG